MKDELRAQLRRRRAQLSPAYRAAADREICQRALAALGESDSFFVYHSFGTEADTHALIGALLSRGKRVFLPRVEGKDMFAVPYDGVCAMQTNKWGIAEPLGQPYFGDIDVTVVPLLAVNGGLCRLGYGGGYYDRFLKDKPTLKVGVGYAFQYPHEFHAEAWDVPLDMFISEKDIIIHENYQR